MMRSLDVITVVYADLSAITRCLDEVRVTRARVDETTTPHSLEAPESNTERLNLAATGKGDPTVLIAATLDRSVFPRLVTTMDDEPPAARTNTRPKILGTTSDERGDAGDSTQWNVPVTRPLGEYNGRLRSESK